MALGIPLVECCYTSIETVGFLGTGAQDGHLDFYTAPELWGFRETTWTFYMALGIPLNNVCVRACLCLLLRIKLSV